MKALLSYLWRYAVWLVAAYCERNLLLYQGEQSVNVQVDAAGRIAGRLPTLADLQSYSVNYPDKFEVIRQPVYDHELYIGAGTNELILFQNQVGQGVTTSPGATVGARKTRSDTNMTLSGQLPSGMNFMIESVELTFFPGTSLATNNFTPVLWAQAANPANAAAATALVAQVNDVIQVLSSGNLLLTVFQKDYLLEAPLSKFPPKVRMDVDGPIAASTGTAALATGSVYTAIISVHGGRPYYIDPPAVIPQNQNFSVKLQWPGGVVATPSTFNARIGCRLDGYTYRQIQ